MKRRRPNDRSSMYNTVGAAFYSNGPGFFL
jgi:hypothetical protein